MMYLAHEARGIAVPAVWNVKSRLDYVIITCKQKLAKGCSILVSSIGFEDGPKNPLRAQR